VTEPDDLRRRNLVSYARWRVAFALLAVVVPLSLFALFRRQELRLRALADHGRQGTAVVEMVTRQNDVLYTHYRYSVEGASYTWSVSLEDAPHEPGESFTITYLPEDASLSRPGLYSRERLDAELDLRFQHRLLGGLFATFAICAALCHRGLRRLQRGEAPRTTPLLSPVGAGRLVAFILVGAVLATSFDNKAQAVQVTLFGPRPFGVPVAIVVTIVEAFLFAPYFWIFPHLMTIVMSSYAKGGSLTKGGIVLAVANAGPELRRSRAIVIGGLVYFVAIVAAWIAFTESRGV
jgi:hypothetical protein